MSSPRGSARPTLEAVAARAGVGRGTVSRVINGSAKVSQQARAAVLQAIEELGYVPNRAARTLVTRRTDTIALVVPEPEERLFGEPFFASTIGGITKELTGTGLQLILAMPYTPAEREHLATYLPQHVDGVLLMSEHAHDLLPRHLEESGLPCVLVGHPAGFEPSSYVDADNRGGARQAVDHLVGQGRREVACITGSLDMAVGVDRRDGYVDGLKAGGLDVDECLIATGDFRLGSGETAMRALLQARPGLDAVFAASDLMALGAIRALKEAGRRVPDDVAVVGFEDSDLARHSDPPLTTVHQPVEAMGREMVRLLVAQLRDEPVDTPVVVLPTRLIVRDSA